MLSITDLILGSYSPTLHLKTMVYILHIILYGTVNNLLPTRVIKCVNISHVEHFPIVYSICTLYTDIADMSQH